MRLSDGVLSVSVVVLMHYYVKIINLGYYIGRTNYVAIRMVRSLLLSSDWRSYKLRQHECIINVSPCLYLCHSEYGDSWHKGGIFEKKQNVFDDFIAAGEYLIQSKYTNPRK